MESTGSLKVRIILFLYSTYISITFVRRAPGVAVAATSFEWGLARAVGALFMLVRTRVCAFRLARQMSAHACGRGRLPAVPSVRPHRPLPLFAHSQRLAVAPQPDSILESAQPAGLAKTRRLGHHPSAPVLHWKVGRPPNAPQNG